MKMRCLILFCLLLSSILADNWAVLVAGSNEWYNYRHQADVCHAYQILHSHGIPDDHLVVMMYDDIANNTNNPLPGVILNHPHGLNVYKNVPKDYTGYQVTSYNFLNVLLGKASGKNIRPTSNDNVFIYMVDHGAPGMFCFPDGPLYADQLQKALEKMTFRQLVLYMESCESGSMFDQWLKKNNSNVYVTTAATPFESSYACYHDERIGVYLGDIYSVNWMEYADARDFSNTTIYQQFRYDRSETDMSHVCEYGNQTISQTSFLKDFLGPTPAPKFDFSSGNGKSVDSRRAKITQIYYDLGKWLTKPIDSIDLVKFAEALLKFNLEAQKLIRATDLFLDFKSNPRPYPGQCYNVENISYECLRDFVEEYFKNQPNEYELEVIAKVRPCLY